MLYNGNAARYVQQDRLRDAERARIARDVARRNGPSATRKVTTTVLSLLTLGLKH
jgi:hypothetical protein